MKRSQPKYFSDHFKIYKSKLKELGVFDPILNFDTKLFVEPLLLKKSSSEIIRNAANNFDQFFIDLLYPYKNFQPTKMTSLIFINKPSDRTTEKINGSKR